MTNYFSTLSGWMIPLSRLMAEENLNLTAAFAVCDVKPQRLILSFPPPNLSTAYLNQFLTRVDKDDLIYVIKNIIYQVLPLGTPS